MPTSGGTADKLGNRYETLWATDQLLQIVDGAAIQLISEDLDLDESRGVEFSVAIADGSTEYWSVKRQTTRASGWTLTLLAGKDDRGRSILGDMLQHVERDPNNRSVFASTLGAPDLEELRAHAATTAMLDARLNRSTDLKSQFLEHLLPLCDKNAERVRGFLLRIRTHAIDEQQLRDRVDFGIRKLLYSAEGLQVDGDAVRGYLAELLVDNIHRPISRETILEYLSAHSIRLRDWAIDKRVRDQMDSICDAYVALLRCDLINGVAMPLAGSEPLLCVGNTPAAKRVLVVAGAGSGKSTTLAQFVERLRVLGVPVLAVRFDQLPEGILTTTELGRKLLLPESPCLVLTGVAAGRQCVLVVDQLDAISIASGRRTEMWTLFDQLRREAERSPNMSLVVGCREFDLEHDHRMRSMKTEGVGFAIVKLGELSMGQVESALRDAGTNPGSIHPTLKPILAIPLHLALFLRLSAASRTDVRSRDDLFDSFWTESERHVNQRVGRKAAFTETIDRLVNWLSDNQELSAPRHVLDDHASDAAAMASEHFLVLAENRYRFFHESLFDYAFARRFSSRGRHLVDLLLAGEQHLFRRAQVRQVLAFLRAQDWPQYLQELETVLTRHDIRFHIKRLVFQWLSSLTDPRSGEWEVLQRASSVAPDLRDHIRSVTAGHVGWFDVIDALGLFDSALSSEDEAREQEAVWMLCLTPILEARSARISELLLKYRKPTERWNQYLRRVCRGGSAFHSPGMFDLFLSLIDDGTLDGARPGIAINDDWWGILYSMSEKRPDLTCEAIAHWFDRRIADWGSSREIADVSSDQGEAWRSLKDKFQSRGHHGHVISRATKAPLSYARELLPRVARFVSETAKEAPNCLRVDPLWCLRTFGDEPFYVHDAIFAGLAKSLEAVAAASPEELDILLGPFQDSPCDAIAFLVLRAWTAAPEIYANRLAGYLADAPRRLKVGYQIGGSGSFQIYVSIEAVKAASGRCSPERFAALEQAILLFRDEWEAQIPQRRGWRQLELLRALDNSRLSISALGTLRELQRKFPSTRHEVPHGVGAGAIGSPISAEAQKKMSDANWLSAMRKYAGVDHRFDRELRLSGARVSNRTGP